MPYRNIFDRVFSLETEIALAVFLAVALVVGTALVLNRARRRAAPSHASKHTAVELGYVAALLGMGIFLVWLSISSNGQAHPANRATPAVTIRVTGAQWCWTFAYVGQGFATTGSCSGGDQLPTLVLPAGKPVKMEVVSADVVHELWIPYARYKVQAFPGHVNSFELTLPRAGQWMGRCSEFCGLYHAFMEFHLRAVSPTAYRHWVTSQRHAPAAR